MLKAINLLFFLLLVAEVRAQLFPGEGDVVNYRLVGFTIPPDEKAAGYLFEISEYYVSDKGEIVTKEIISQHSDSNRTIVMLPDFDKGYAWRVSYLNSNNKTRQKTPYYHFRTGNYPTIDSSQFRLKIIDSATHHKDLFILLDFISVIFDMNGKPVWYLPDISLVKDKNLQMRDLKPTKDGTFTATTNFGAFEMDYNGKLLWAAPNDGRVNGDTMEYYHHEFTKLDNGNYMVAALQYEMRRIPDWLEKKTGTRTTAFTKGKDGHYYKKITAGNLIEYNQQKEVVWSWKSTDHFTDDDFFRKHASNELFSDMHLNAFDFDRENNVIYMSFRNINEIVKIAYPSGEILKRYGAIWINDSTLSGESLFYGQHCVRKGADGRIFMFNNNSNPMVLKSGPERMKSVSQVSFFREDSSKTGLKKVWEMGCDIDTFAEVHGGAGGSVIELEDKCILVSMGSASRIFIATPEKKIIWNVLPQSGDTGGNWYPLGQYRVTYLTKKDLEKFIFK